MMGDLRQLILNTVNDTMSNLLYYDRKDENLSRGVIEAAIKNGVVTIDEIVDLVRTALVNSVARA